MNINRSTLFEILGTARPHDSVHEVRFCKEYLDKLPGMTADGFGNRILRIGKAPVLWSCHVDTVASDSGFQLVAFDPETGIASLQNGNPGQCLGADDGAGVWLMLAMIEVGVEGLYVFHRGEERGCLGSRWIVENTPELLSGIDAAIALDRAGTRDVITHQMVGMTASDDFALSLAAQLNLHKGLRFRPDNTGVYTDTNEYAGLVPECTNLSVGYECQHGHRETLDVYFLEKLLVGLCSLDLSALTIKRERGEGNDSYYGGHRDSGGGSGKDFYDMLEAVRAVPAAAAELLMSLGYDADALLDFSWEPWEDGRDYNPAFLMDRAYERAWEADRDPFDPEFNQKELEHDVA